MRDILRIKFHCLNCFQKKKIAPGRIELPLQDFLIDLIDYESYVLTNYTTAPRINFSSLE
jgi:hypothetical protein